MQGIGVDSGNSQPMSADLPQSQNGSILITSRNKGIAKKLVEEKNIIVVEPMAQAHALALFEKKLGSLGDGNDIAELAAALEYMPLAIVQSAAYIHHRAPRSSVRQYLETFRKSDSKKTSLLNYEGGQLRRDKEAKNSIIITWQISFEYVQQSRPSAADLLSLMSFFDRQGIPESLVRNRAQTGSGSANQSQSQSQLDQDMEKENGKESGEDSGPSAADLLSLMSFFGRQGIPEFLVRNRAQTGSGSANQSQSQLDQDMERENGKESGEDGMSDSSEDDGFEDDVQVLRNYSFISCDTARTFEMHALVQLAMRKWLEAHEQLEPWKQQFVKSLSTAFPPGEYENWAICQALFPHAKSAIAHRPKTESSLNEWASLMYNAAWYRHEKGSAVEAIQLHEMALEVRKKNLGQEHSGTLKSMGMLGRAYELGGQLKKAEALLVQTIEIAKRQLGEEHLDTLYSMNSLAVIYSNQGRLKEAEELQLPVMEIRKRVLGKEHLATLTSTSNLALIYLKQGRWKEIEELQLQVMEILKRLRGEEHPHTLASINNLALTYWNQGRLKEAEKLQLPVIEISKRVLGEEHPSTLNCLNNLTMIYLNQERYKEAKELQSQVIEIGKRLKGEEHPDTLISIGNLAVILFKNQEYLEAEKLQERVMEISKRVLGKEHHVTLTSMTNLVCIWKEQGGLGELAKVVDLMDESPHLRTRVLGPEHDDTKWR